MIYKKIEQLISIADIMVEGSINDFPKNLTNFKLVLESVKMILENEKEKELNNPLLKAGTLGAPFDDQSTLGPTKTSLVKIEELPEPEPEIIKEEEVPKKRKRRTKAEMAAAALEKANEIENKLDNVIEQIKVIPEPVNINKKEDWEKTLEDEINDVKEDVPWGTEKIEEVIDSVENISENLPTVEEEISSLINKYPNPLNLSLLENRIEKVALVADMNLIKTLVGNESTADIKDCLSILHLDDDITIRAYKFLMVLPHLERELK